MSALLAYLLCLALAAPIVWLICKRIERTEPRRKRTVEPLAGWPADQEEETT